MSAIANQESKNRRLEGYSISPGIAVGRALVLESGQQLIFKKEVAREALAQEVNRMRQAVNRSKRQLQAIRKRLVDKLGEPYAYIMDTHILMLEDKALLDAVLRQIEEERVNAEWAVKEQTDKLIAVYASLKEEYFRERATDIKDVSHRILLNLTEHRRSSPLWPLKNSIIIARSLNPSILAELDFTKVKAFALENGGYTSHTAILARSIGIPAVTGIANATASISSGEMVIVDGDQGHLLIAPTQKEITHCKKTQVVNISANETPGACRTLDGVKITLEVNAERLNQILPAMRAGAQGVGLFRSEFLLFDYNRANMSSEEEQFRIYKTLGENTQPYGAAIRTFDLGGDKQTHLFSGGREVNPALGLRGIRLSLQSQDSFRTQIRAILRASHFGHLQIILPLISRIEEVLEAKAILRESQAELKAAGIPFSPKIALGVMIEVPAAVLLADFLCREVDFFCIGTNDLIQYTLAVDRGDEQVEYLFEPFHPSVLRSIALVVKSAHHHKIPVKVCGEAVSNPMYAMTLLGMGITCFSLNMNAIPVIQKLMKSISRRTAVSLTRKVCSFATVKEVEDYISKKIHLPRYLA